MNSTKELLHQIADRRISLSERAHLRCKLAKQFEEAGNFESSREAMGDLWQGAGIRPNLDGLDDETAAEVLLRVGALTGHLGSSKQIQAAQELAKNLLSECYSRFEKLKKLERVAEVQIETSVCYWREGAFDEARVVLQEAIHLLGDSNNELYAVALLRTAIVEGSAKRLNDALRIYLEAAPLFESNCNEVLKGKFHHGFGFVLKNLGTAEQRQDYIDRALIEYAAASFYFEQAGLSRYQGCVENNLGFLFATIGKFVEAHEHLDRAQALFTTLRDAVHLAQVDETRARVMLAAGRVSEAEKLARTAVRTLEKGGEQSLLAEALTTQGIAQARLPDQTSARATLERAIDVAQQAGDPESAGQAALTLLEELGQQLCNEDICAILKRASELLEKSQDMNTLRRLLTCAFRVFFLIQAFPEPPNWSSFEFKQTVRRFEAGLIKRALQEAGGSVTRAAYLLGFGHHQTLVSLLNSRHKNLQNARRPVKPRKRKQSSAGETPGGKTEGQTKDVRPIRILHVEDNETVARAIKEVLNAEGWKVETCFDGAAARERIASQSRFDLLLLDYDLPKIKGSQLIQYSRRLPHRRQTPIVILSASLDETAAAELGADDFLAKPVRIEKIVQTIARLLRPAAVDKSSPESRRQS